MTLFKKRIALDLGAVEFFDSTGLHIVGKASASLREVGGELWVSAASERVRRAVELAGMDEVLALPATTEKDEH